MRRMLVTLTFARQGIAAHPGESLLTAAVFAVLFAAALLAVTIVRSGRREFTQSMDRLGRRLVHVHPGLSLRALLGGAMTPGDIDLCRQAAQGPATGAKVVTGVVTTSDAPDAPLSAVLVGTDAAWPEVNDSRFAAGRFFTEGAAGECTIESLLARRLFGSADALGKTLTVRWAGRSHALVITGVIADPLPIRERLDGPDVLHRSRPLIYRVLDGQNLYVPRRVIDEARDLSFCLVKHAEELTAAAAVKRLEEAFGDRAASMFIWARGPFIDAITEMVDLLRTLSNVVWALFAALAAAMVTTLSLMTTQGRIQELGVRRTQGATRAAIVAQLLIEGGILAGGGALIGLATGPFLGAWLARNLPWTLTWHAGETALITAVGLGCALLSFAAPALRAGRVEPLAALRTP